MLFRSFLYEYGKKIFDKITDVMNPQFEDEEPMNPFDLWEGADFKLKIRKVEGYRNYDKSEFDSQSAIAESDEEIEEIWKGTHSLAAEVAPDKFKTYEALEARLNLVLGLNVDTGPTTRSAPAPQEDEDEGEDLPEVNDIEIGRAHV